MSIRLCSWQLTLTLPNGHDHLVLSGGEISLPRLLASPPQVALLYALTNLLPTFTLPAKKQSKLIFFTLMTLVYCMACKSSVETQPPVTTFQSLDSQARKPPQPSASKKKPHIFLKDAHEFNDYHQETRKQSLMSRRTSIIQAIQKFALQGGDWLTVDKVAPQLTLKKTGASLSENESVNMCMPPDQLTLANFRLQKWFKDTIRNGGADSTEIKAALILLDQYLFSIASYVEGHKQARDKVFKFVEYLTTPTLQTILSEDWHFCMQLIGGFIDAIEIFCEPDTETASPTKMPKNILEHIFCLINQVPVEKLSPPCLASYHSYKARMYVYLGQQSLNMLRELKMAAETGDSEPQLKLALLYCGLFPCSEELVNLDTGCEWLFQLKLQPDEPKEDYIRTLQQEEYLLSIDAGLMNIPDKSARDITRLMCQNAFGRLFGVGYKKDKVKFEALLQKIKSIYPPYYILFSSMIDVLHNNPKNITVLTGLPSSAMGLWFKGKRYEMLEKPREALQYYLKASTENAFISGMAPIRVACSLCQWKTALKALYHYRDALQSKGLHEEALTLEEEITRLTLINDDETSPQLQTHKQKKRGKRKHSKKIKAKATNIESKAASLIRSSGFTGRTLFDTARGLRQPKRF